MEVIYLQMAWKKKKIDGFLMWLPPPPLRLILAFTKVFGFFSLCSFQLPHFVRARHARPGIPTNSSGAYETVLWDPVTGIYTVRKT